MGVTDLGSDFGISRRTVAQVVHGQTWKEPHTKENPARLASAGFVIKGMEFRMIEVSVYREPLTRREVLARERAESLAAVRGPINGLLIMGGFYAACTVVTLTFLSWAGVL